MVFDALLYTAAIVSVLAIIGSHKAPATRPARQVLDTLETLHAIGGALPSEVFAIDVPDYDELFAEADAIVPPAVQPAVFDCGDISTIVESELVDAAEVAIALYWEARPTCNVVPFRRAAKHPALEGLGIRELKKLASAARIAKYSNLTKAQLIQALRAA